MNNKTVFSGREPDSVTMAVLSPQEARYLVDTCHFLVKDEGRLAFHSISLVWASFSSRILTYLADEHRSKGELDDWHRLLVLATAPDVRPKLDAIYTHCKKLRSLNEFLIVKNLLDTDLGEECDDQTLHEIASKLERFLREWARRVTPDPGHNSPQAA